jgi:flagellar basal body rod protein FlgG
MNAFSYGVNSTAHNLANVNTNGFKAGRVTYEELPGQAGTAANGPQKMDTMGALVPYGPGLPPLENQNPAVPEGYAETSNTDVPREMVNLIVNSRSYQANAKTIETTDSMLGIAINMIA